MSTRRAQSLPPHMLEQSKPERGRCVTAICFSWKVITCIVSHVTLILLVVSYCVGGAYLFRYLERPHEIEVKQGIHYMRLNLTEKIWRSSDNVSVLNESDWIADVKKDLANFEKQILTVMKSDGWDGDEDITKSQWTFAGSLFYSIIVITTIGYGHISPRTDWGKVTTIFYAIIGIPLMLLCLSNIGDVMATSFRFIYWRVCCYVCTRTSKRSRQRSRQRSVRAQRFSSRSQPPPYRRSIKLSQRSSNSAGLPHAYSDPELRTVVRDLEYGRAPGKHMHSTIDRRNDRRHQHQHQHTIAPPSLSRGGSTRNSHIYDDSQTLVDDGVLYTQTMNRASRFSSRQKNRDRMHDRHTIERERYLSHSKQRFDSTDDLMEFAPTVKRTLSVRNLPRDEGIRESRETRELNRLNTQHQSRGRSVNHQANSNSRGRAKSVDPRLSLAHYEDLDEELIRKTPIITNRYAISELEQRKHHHKDSRSHSTPRAAFQRNQLNHTDQRQQSYSDSQQNHHCERQHSSYPSQGQRRASISRPISMGPPSSNRYGNHLELPEFKSSHRLKQTPSARRSHNAYEEEYDDEYFEETDYRLNETRMREYDDEYDYARGSISRYRDRKPRKDKADRLPPSPRIMSPMGFAVKRQVRRRPSYEYDEDSLYGDEWSDYYGDISPKDRPVPIWLCVFLVISYILGGAALFAYWEEWSFLDSAYFCFITLTTIGFGDFVPAKGVKDESEQSIAYCSLYLLFGIALLAMSFNLVQEEFIANVKEVARRLGILKDEDDDDD
uniref:Potassium channel domain-containing protein n=1 Tax=Glossina pallidipes TaxID=7398 RepID=A0A1B0A2G8_GLOPL